jgi:formylglycine-generating enzyme required for sulfatase activity
MTTIYLSSTYQDLKAYRAAVFNALRQSGHQVIAMEDYVARDERPVKACLNDVERADIYVGLFAFRYGYIPPAEHGNPEGRSITELEFRHADASPDTHCLVFLLDEKAPWSNEFNDTWTEKGEKRERIRRLREELSREKMGSFFSGTFELATKVQSAVSQVLLATQAGAAPPAEQVPETTWDVAELGSPYPGLMHFTPRFAPVFFGREAEVRELLDRLTLPEGRFVIVSGDSGTGKSSLIDAGVLPRLAQQGLPEDRSVSSVRMVPGQGSDPFDALLRGLHGEAERAGLDPYGMGRELAAGHEGLAPTLGRILSQGSERDALILFLDQMEELFTAADGDQGLTSRFLSGLYAATQTLPLWVVATIRSDLLHHCYAHRDMLEVLRGPGHYPLGRVAPHMMHDMIVRPARCAGVSVPEALASRLMKDTGSEPGNLPLLAFVLQRLFDESDGKHMSLAAYEAIGGLTGAIAEQVRDVERRLADGLGQAELERRLAELFQTLVRVDVEGMPTRRRIRKTALPEALRPLAEGLIKGRLLAPEGEGAESGVSVAHERLFQAWPALAHWVAEHQDELRLLRQGELDAAEWHRHDHDLAYLWHIDRLKRLQSVIEGLPRERAGEALRAFAWPQQRLARLLDDAKLDHETRDTIGRHLAALGDARHGVGVREDGTPDIAWVAIPGGKVELEGRPGKARVKAFHMARYLVTNAQFQAFVDAADGYAKPDWWKDMPKDANDGPEKPRWSEPNGPRESVSWDEAIAFCRWLSARLGLDVRLPTEYEWQQAATGADPHNVYPWGRDWDARCCNTVESGLNRTTAVGLYPAGASAQGVLDLAGNLWEWCLDKYDSPGDTAIDDSGGSRVLRGGSWGGNEGSARADYRDLAHPDDRRDYSGFRVVCASPIH